MEPKVYEDVKAAGKKGNKAQMARVLVEGKYFTYAQISEATGVPHEKVKGRYGHMKRRGVWPITMELLKGNGA